MVHRNNSKSGRAFKMIDFTEYIMGTASVSTKITAYTIKGDDVLVEFEDGEIFVMDIDEVEIIKEAMDKDLHISIQYGITLHKKEEKQK